MTRECSVGEWYGREPLTTLCGAVYVVKNNYNVKLF